MSNSLAIAAVTAVLKDMLDNTLSDASISASGSQPVLVSALPPQQIHPETDDRPRLNLFLYQVTPNPGWRNADLPSRSPRGERVAAPPLALDLHYMLTAYGKKDFEAEILLGYAMQLLHETPVLSREAIRRTFAPPVPDGVGMLPEALQALTATDLAEQVEQIKLTPQPMSTEDISKLWAAFQAGYRPSVIYHASVVLIESARPARVVAQVRQPHVVTLPFHRPMIEGVIAQLSERLPRRWRADERIILAEDTIALVGSDLEGDGTSVLLDSAEYSPAPDSTATRLRLKLPADLPAGIHRVQTTQSVRLEGSSEGHRLFSSNVVPFVLHPQITASAEVIARSRVEQTVICSVGIAIDVTPSLRRGQRVVVLLNELLPEVDAQQARPRAAHAYQFEIPVLASDTGTLTAQVDNVVEGTYLIRLHVDGVESPIRFELEPAPGAWEPKAVIR